MEFAQKRILASYEGQNILLLGEGMGKLAGDRATGNPLSTQVPPDVPSCVRVTEQKIRAVAHKVLFEKSHHTGSVNGT